MAMVSGDRSGGHYVSYTTSVPYELSKLTKELFDLMGKGISGEQLWTRLQSASDSELETLQRDLTVYADQDFAKNDTQLRETLKSIREMADAVMESRKPGPKLLSSLLEMLNRGTTLGEVLVLLKSSTPEALRALPNLLDSMMAKLKTDDPPNASQLDPFFAAVKELCHEATGNSRQSSLTGR